MNEWVAALPQDKVDEWLEKRGEQAMQRHHTDDPHFALWLHFLDKEVMRRVMVSYQDLEDWPYRDAYDGGMSPRDAAMEMLDDAGWGYE